MSNERERFPGSGREADRGSEAEYDAVDREDRVRQLAMRRRLIQRKASRQPDSGAKIPTGGGAALSNELRARMEPELGADLSAVKVHTGGQSAAAAETLGARAFTTGSDVHFGAGEFAPGTKEGDRLIAHELTHAVQAQKFGIQRKADDGEYADGEHNEVSQPGDPAEQEADAVADNVTANLHSVGGKKITRAPGKHAAPQIGAKLTGRKISRSPKSGAAPKTDNAHDGNDKKQASPESGNASPAKKDQGVHAAAKYNAAHPDLVAEFNKLTGGKCAGDDAGVSVHAVRQWQMAHGLPADGKVGPKTIATARKEAKAAKVNGEAKEAAGGAEGSGERSDVTFADNAAGDPMQKGDLAEQVVAGGETGGEEKRESSDAGEALGEGGSAIKEGGEKGSNLTGLDQGEGPRADILKHDAKELGASEAVEEAGEEGKLGTEGKVGLSIAVRAALVPQIIDLMRAHKFGDALRVIWKSVNYEERVELVKYIIEKVGGELSRRALEIFERAAIAGAVADVLILGWEWTYGGLKAIAEAHEKGDRDSRIAIYAYAWSDTVMTGHHSNPGAIGAESIEAKERGIEDGEMSRALSPDLPSLLLAQYDNDPDNARRALEDALLKRAGFSGIKTHRG